MSKAEQRHFQVTNMLTDGEMKGILAAVEKFNNAGIGISYEAALDIMNWPDPEQETKDAERWQFLLKHLTKMVSPDMSGQHHWRMRYFRDRGQTFEEAFDKYMERTKHEAKEYADYLIEKEKEKND